jgi:predicted DNA binding CopG/RHH family protein
MTRVARIHYEIPDDLHRRVKATAAMRGMTLKDYIVEVLSQAVETDARERDRPDES